jgi:hypothetical protein
MRAVLELLAAPRPAVDALLDGWRTSRSGALGSLLVDLGHAAPAADLRASTVGATIARFDAEAASCGPDDRMAWVALVPVGKRADAERQLDVLRGYGPDPRIADHLLRLFEAPPFRSRPMLPWWTTLLEIVAASADTSTDARLATVHDQLRVGFSGPMADKLAGAIEATRAALPASPEESRELLAAIDAARSRWLASRVEVDVDALLEQVYADPTDHARLQVYADAAQSVGDPRGEAVAISLLAGLGRKPSPARRKQLRQLEKHHRETWLGPLARVLIPSTVELRHTFLHRAVIKPKHQREVEAVLGDPRWSTARHLEVRAVADYHDVNASGAWRAVEAMVAHPVLANLQSLTGDLSDELVVGFCTGEPRRLECLQVGLHRDRADIPHLADTDRLPRLRHLIGRSYHHRLPDDWRWFTAGSVFRQLDHLELRIGVEGLASWWRWFADQPLPVLELTDTWGHTRVRMDRGVDGVSVDLRHRYASGLDPVIGWLESLDDGTLVRFTDRWRANTHGAPTAAMEQRLRTAASRVAQDVRLPKPG